MSSRVPRRATIAVGLVLTMAAIAGCAGPAATTALRDCGAEDLLHGTGQNVQGRTCLLDAAGTGTPAVFVSRLVTFEGDPIVRTYLVVSTDEVRIEHDARQDRYGSGRIEILTCPMLVPVADWNAAMGESLPADDVFVEHDCQPAGTR